MIRYGSVCSGIEAATAAWHPLGWSPVFFSEIEKFPSSVLAHHYGSNMPGEALASNGVPNLGDMTKFEEWPDYAIDLLVGGTPCQDYSIAGKRLGMAGSRGQLTLSYVEIAARYRPCWVAWENVPGVLSSNEGRDFARFLGELSGQSIEVPTGGWKNSGIVSGIEDAYGLAYRVLDAQFIRVDGYVGAVPQRRRRVFVVGYLGDWRRAAAVLLEPEGMCGDPAPRREPGQGTAPTLSARTNGGGGLGSDFEIDGGLIANSGDVSYCVSVNGQRSNDYETETLVAHALRGEGFDASEDGTGRGTPIIPVAFSSKDFGADAMEDCSSTLRSGGHNESHANAGVPPAIAIQERAISENPNAGPDGKGFRDDGAAYTLEARTVPQAVAFAQNSRNEIRVLGGNGQIAGALSAEPGMKQQTYLAETWAVRRLTPKECHRLQGFEDGFCNIPWRGKDHAPDGPQYKALGNSMAVNVMRWIGQRIEMVENL